MVCFFVFFGVPDSYFQAILARRVIDCTGDADVAYLSGCPFTTLNKDERMGCTQVFNASGVEKVRHARSGPWSAFCRLRYGMILRPSCTATGSNQSVNALLLTRLNVLLPFLFVCRAGQVPCPRQRQSEDLRQLERRRVEAGNAGQGGRP